MENIIFVLMIPIFLALLTYPIFGLTQIVKTVVCYLEGNRHPIFYRDARRYFVMILMYTLLGLVIFNPIVSQNIPAFFFLIYLFISFIIVMYNVNIMKKNHYEEIEKLIF